MSSRKWRPFCLGLNVLLTRLWVKMFIEISLGQYPIYRKTSSISPAKSHNLNVSNLVLQLPLFNPLKPGVKSRMKM